MEKALVNVVDVNHVQQLSEIHMTQLREKIISNNYELRD